MNLRDQKQKYLRENILQKDYDAEQFMDFCDNDKGSVDIDSWSLAELKDIVNRFIDQQNKKKIGYNDFGWSNYESPTNYNNKTQENNKNNDMFDNWSDFVQPVQPQNNNQNLGLNSVDLDFLQMMGMPIPQQKKQTKPLNLIKPQTQPQLNQSKKMPPKNEAVNYHQDFIKKINEDSDNFISAYNKTFLQKNNSQSVQQQSQYKQSKPQQQYSFTQGNQINQQNFSSKQSSVIQPQVKSDRQIPLSKNFQHLDRQIKCKQIHKNRLTDNILCTVSGHQIVNPNVFVPNFVLYTINSTPLNVSVKRRMKDFQQLRSLFKKMFPTTQIPHLERYSRLSQTEPDVIVKQKLYIQSFLNAVLMNPTLKCKILEDFLLCTDLQLIKKIFRQYQKMQRPKALQDLWTLNGSVRLDTKASDRRYMSQQVLFIEYVDNSFSKLKSQYDQLIALHLGTMKCMNQISDIYDQLRQTTKNVNMMFPQQMKFQNFEPIINNISHLHKEWANSFQTQAKILQTQIKHMFKYQNTNIDTIKQLHKTLISTFDTYQKRVDRQVPSREPYQSKKLSQFKVYAQSPSKNIQVLRHQAAYCQTQFKQQTLRYIDQLGKKLGNKFLIFCTLQLSIAGDLDIVWRQFQKFIQK